MARTVVLVGFLMMAGFIAMIMLNLSHAHSELDNLQTSVEVHSRDLKVLTQASNQLASDLRDKASTWGDLAASVDKQKAMIEQQEQRIATVSDQQRKSRGELQQARNALDELWHKVLETPTTTEASTDEKDLLDKRQEEQIMFLKAEVSNLQDKVSEMMEDLVRVQTAKAEQPASSASVANTVPETPAPSAFALRGPAVSNRSASSALAPASAETESEAPGPAGSEGSEVEAEGEAKTAETEAESQSGDASPAAAEGENEQQVESEPESGLEEADLAPGVSEIKQVIWFKECGCTGMEIEAVNFLRGLIARLGYGRVRTNRCSETCRWPSEVLKVLAKISEDEKSLLSKPPEPGTVVVVHAAYLGVCGLPESFLPALQDPNVRKELLLVSRSMFETDRLEEDAASRCNLHFDSVWVPSSASEKAFKTSGVEEAKLQILPEPLDTELFACRSSPDDTLRETNFGVTEMDQFLSRRPRSSFVFLSAFKWEPRKNWESLLENFIRAFPTLYTPVVGPAGQEMNVSVRLLIKTQWLSWSTEPAQDVPDFLKSIGVDDATLEGRLLVTDTMLKTSDLPKLYQAADAFVLPSHGEGWGLPLIEAMASGLPTIGTAWGGQTDFMDKENSWPIDYELVESPTPPMRWAEPKAEELRKAMLAVVAGGPEVEARIARACQEVHSRYTISGVSSKALDLLKLLVSTAAGSAAAEAPTSQ